MSETRSADEFLIVSDLHLASPDRRTGATGSGAESAVRSADFAAFIREHLGGPEGGPHRRLVLLGDTLDLPTHQPGSAATRRDAWTKNATDELHRIVDAHREAFDAVAAFLEGGGRVDILAGNHDVALQMPAVRQALVERLGDSHGAVTWHPWMLYLPGLLWAEHGSQHHDLHAVPEWLEPRPERTVLGLPPGRSIEGLVSALRRPHARRALVAAGASVLTDLLAATVARPGLAGRRAAYRATSLPAIVKASGIPEPTLRRIDRISESDAWSIAARLLRRRVGRGDRGPASFLGPAARQVDAILAGAGLDVPVYAFGHTHAPAVLPPGEPVPGAWFANAGSWAGLRPAALRQVWGARRYPFLTVRSTGASPAADEARPVSLLTWNGALARVEDVPG